MSEFEKPESRAEAILQNILGADNDLGAPQSRIEVLLMMLLEEFQGGGSGGAIVVDTDLSTTSKNPVENKVITAKINYMDSELFSTIADIPMNTSTGSMELYAKDLDDILTSGFYNAMECQNAPFSYMTLIVVGYYLAGYCAQIACDVTTGTYKVRNLINGTWSAWKEVMLEEGGSNGN